jgi:hypothetical protein
MARFRVTPLVVCLVLVVLGGNDLRTVMTNLEPARTSVADLERAPPHREWLAVEGGFADLPQAISASGSVEVDAFLVPLKSAPDAPGYRVLVETRDPAVVDALKAYHFHMDSEEERRRFAEEHRELFFGRRDVTGMVMTGLVGASNRDRLRSLASRYGEALPADPLLISEGKEPARLRGLFFAAMGLLGLFKLASRWKGKTRSGSLAPAR